MSNEMLQRRLLDQFFPEVKATEADIPPYGVCEVRGWEHKQPGPGALLLGYKPKDAREYRYAKFINGPATIKQNKTGRVSRTGVLVCKMKKPTTDGDLAYGQMFVATEQAFELKRTFVPPFGCAFIYLGGYQATQGANTGVGMFEYRPVAYGMFFGTLTGRIAAKEDDEELEVPQSHTARVLVYNFDTRKLEQKNEVYTVHHRFNVEIPGGVIGCMPTQGEIHTIVTGCN